MFGCVILRVWCGAHCGGQVPESVVEGRSPAYNKGRVFIHGAEEATAVAYRKQFQTDLAGFLRARAQELKRGGSMFLVCLGRTSVDPTDQGGAGLLFGTHFQDAWDDLVQEVTVTQININFTFPILTPNPTPFSNFYYHMFGVLCQFHILKSSKVFINWVETVYDSTDQIKSTNSLSCKFR